MFPISELEKGNSVESSLVTSCSRSSSDKDVESSSSSDDRMRKKLVTKKEWFSIEEENAELTVPEKSPDRPARRNAVLISAQKKNVKGRLPVTLLTDKSSEGIENETDRKASPP